MNNNLNYKLGDGWKKLILSLSSPMVARNNFQDLSLSNFYSIETCFGERERERENKQKRVERMIMSRSSKRERERGEKEFFSW